MPYQRTSRRLIDRSPDQSGTLSRNENVLQGGSLMLGAVPLVLGSRAVRGLIGQIGGQARSKLSSFGALFTLELLDLVALALDRALLILDLTLLLLRGDFLILQRIADHVAGARPERT